MEEINIQARGFELTEEIRRYTIKKLIVVFGADSVEVSKIFITLFNKNKSRDEKNMRCRIQVKTRRHPFIIIERRSSNILTAIDSAVHYAGQNM